MPGNNKDRDSSLNALGKYVSLGISMAVIVGGSVAGGIFLDRKISVSVPVFTLLFSALGMFAAFWYLFKNTKE